MKISFLLPSRKKPSHLIPCVQSILDTVSKDNEIEILLALDNDDDTRFEVIKKFKKVDCVKCYIRPRSGFWKLHEYTNYLANQAAGDMFFITTDKSLMQTTHWDKLLEPYEGKFIVTFPTVNWISRSGQVYVRPELLFPIVSHLWFVALNKICDQPHLDSSISHVLGNFPTLGEEAKNLMQRILFPTNMIVQYDESKEIEPKVIGQSTFFTEESSGLRMEDAKRLFLFLKANPSYIL